MVDKTQKNTLWLTKCKVNPIINLSSYRKEGKDEILPERLRDIRILKGYTVEYVASQLGVTKQAVSKYETGRMIPSSDVLNRIADFFLTPVLFDEGRDVTG